MTFLAVWEVIMYLLPAIFSPICTVKLYPSATCFTQVSSWYQSHFDTKQTASAHNGRCGGMLCVLRLLLYIVTELGYWCLLLLERILLDVDGYIKLDDFLMGPYLSTPWLSSPHLQTMLLHLLVETHNFTYKRELFISSGGGTLALDWLMNFDEIKFQVKGDSFVAKAIPLVIVIPGLTSDSDSPYIKHVAYKMAKHGWNVVISNHRGLGGVPLTSDCIYTAGWTEDLREVVNHLHCTHPEAPLFAIGTNLGANILVKYLGEDGANAPLVGGASICNPWDILMCDRFFGRGLMQRFYNIVLANALKDVAKLHQVVYARIADWEGIEKAGSVGEFNKYTGRITGNFEYEQKYCSSNHTTWRTMHFLKGCLGRTCGVRVIEEYFSILHSSSLMNKNTGATAVNT